MPLWHVAFPGFLIISSVSGIVNVMSVVVPAAACLLILGSFGSHYYSLFCSLKSRLQNVKLQYQYVYWGGDTNIKAAGMTGIFSSPAEVTGMSAV
jgi:hypothetical protein